MIKWFSFERALGYTEAIARIEAERRFFEKYTPIVPSIEKVDVVSNLRHIMVVISFNFPETNHNL